MNIISKEKINVDRQIEVDLFRGFTAIILVLCHVALYLGDNGDHSLFVFGDIIGSEFAAPVFMSMMGISIIYTKHNSAKQLFIRGLHLFLSGYLLNLVRSLLAYIIIPNANYFSTFESLFIIDILPFAGLSFMVISLFKLIKTPSWLILIISLVFAFLDEFFFNLSNPITTNKYLACALNLFVPVNEYSCFPFFTWFFFPSFGIFLGEILVRTSDKNKLYLFYLIIGAIGLIIVYGSFIYLYPNYTVYYKGNNFYYMGVLNLILNGSLICFGLAFWYFISKIIPKFFENYLKFLSKNLYIFYWFSWIVIALILHLSSYFKNVFDTYVVIILMICVQFVTSLLTMHFLNYKNKKKQEKPYI